MRTLTADEIHLIVPELKNCERCGQWIVTSPGDTGEKLCRMCWTVEELLPRYLQSTSGREFVRAALEKASKGEGE